MNKIRIGIVGCGAIGSSLAKTIKNDFKSQACLAAVYDIDKNKSGNFSVATTFSQLIQKSDLVIESSSAKCSYEIARAVLSKGKDVVIMSVGGISAKFNTLNELAKRKNAKIYIPSGAIAGIDALKAAKISEIKEVILTTTKNPLSFKGVKFIEDRNIKLDTIKKDKVLFFGAAKEAVKYFPQNINVAAILSIAGIGLDKTKVKIVASPQVKRNIHEIKIISKAGDIYTRTENVLHPDNPKTSYLAFLSAVAVLKQILEPVRIGS
ncbi:MAG: aspartate dehydrogenase [Candidatus Omnitrophica bacterium]|nr:aspartate dehydrogenase [Candidatus Omnitrophota bacterium]